MQPTQGSGAAVNSPRPGQGPSSAQLQTAGAAPPPPLAATVVTTLEFDLGRFLPSSAPSSASSHETRPSSSPPPELTPFYIANGTELVQGATWEDTFARQIYVDGTPCGLAPLVHKARKTEVRFVCDQSAAQSATQSATQSTTQSAHHSLGPSSPLSGGRGRRSQPRSISLCPFPRVSDGGVDLRLFGGGVGPCAVSPPKVLPCSAHRPRDPLCGNAQQRQRQKEGGERAATHPTDGGEEDRLMSQQAPAQAKEQRTVAGWVQLGEVQHVRHMPLRSKQEAG